MLRKTKRKKKKLTFVQPSHKLATRNFMRTWQCAPQEALDLCFHSGFYDVLALGLFAHGVFENGLETGVSCGQSSQYLQMKSPYRKSP